MLGARLKTLIEEVQALTQCKNVKFSRPPVTAETRSDTPSKYALGGLRHHGEWITAFCKIENALRRENVDFGEFAKTKTGQSFIRAIASRAYSLNANDIYEILLTMSVHKTKVDSLESVLVEELEGSLEHLRTFQLLSLPSLIARMDDQFLRKLKKVTPPYTHMQTADKHT
ncbi:conserved hypothetical protein [Theileria orientalis strain Shintoku]|uniref:Uncharacterized protein n=1 Tax=Theileria orientalis strain Shintoku TaxID=869250 RepID=J4DPW9_THEOR|nr:conserved hypothetical protein [Theileria orientalis strain Shintoku]BAM41434.1 conserved hypothetical protein [Theileria orientalis strain Shintoku]|eukprot:XP_009691735.1 conserved hypothetical protein [Theileria orientalis strain Shintoku]